MKSISRLLIACFALVSLALASPLRAKAEKRIAFVVGNAAYEAGPPAAAGLSAAAPTATAAEAVAPAAAGLSAAAPAAATAAAEAEGYLRLAWLAALPLVLLRPMIASAAFAVRSCVWQPEPKMFT